MSKIDLLRKPNWTYKDIMEYVGCGKTKAIELKNLATQEHDGAIKYLPHCVKRDSVLKTLGTNYETELKINNI